MNKRLRKLERKVLPTNLMKQMNNIFDLYFNNTNVSVAVVDLDTRVIQVNKAFEKLYGWTNDEVIGETLSTVPSHLLEQFKNKLHSVIQTNQALNFETHKLRKSGELFHASVTITPLKDNTGSIFALVEVARDISLRKMEAEKLKESEERYRNLVELSPQPIVVYSNFIIVYVNPAALKLLGAEDGGQLLGKSVLEFIHPDYVHELHMHEDSLLKEKTPSDIIEKKMVRLDKQIIDVEVRAVPIDYLGKPSIQLLCRDITHKKIMEHIVRERDEEYRRMLKLLPEPIIVHQEGIICYINDVGLQLLGAQVQSDLIGKTIFTIIHPDYHDLAKNRIKSAVLADNYIPFIELTLLGLNGEQIAIEASSVVLDSYLERPVIQTVFRDITERKTTEEMLRQSEKLSVVGQLAAGIAHEIRNPLTSLVGFSQLIKSASHKKILEYAEIMLVELNRINSIVNEFMLIAKPQNSKFEVKCLYEIIDNVVSLLQPQAILHNVDINFEKKNEALVKCDEVQLKQVFINLIKNSVEAMPSGGRIEITLQCIGSSRMLIKIKDFGVGIAEDLLPNLGNPFFTTKEEGTGLGLMVCYRIIEAHQGALKIYSKLGLGTTIEIELPYVVTEDHVPATK